MAKYLSDEEVFGAHSQSSYLSDEEVFGTAKPKKKRERDIADVTGDVLVTAAKGAVGLPQALAGLADIPTGGRVGKALEEVGYRPEEAKQLLDTWYSPAQQEANREVREADGFMPTLKAAIENPSVIATTVGESIPQMLGGAAVARGVMAATAGKVAPWAAGALGEGVMGAGSAASQIRAETNDGLLTPTQAGAAVASGLGTAALGAAGGKLAQRMGVADVDTLLAQGAGKLSQTPAGFAKAVVGSGISEGVFEELPQSVQEQMWQNFALNRPLTQGVGNAAALGLLSGAAMGGAGGGYNAAMQAMGKESPNIESPSAITPDTGNTAADMALPTPAITSQSSTPTTRLAELEILAEQRDLTPAEQTEVADLFTQLQQEEPNGENTHGLTVSAGGKAADEDVAPVYAAQQGATAGPAGPGAVDVLGQTQQAQPLIQPAAVESDTESVATPATRLVRPNDFWSFANSKGFTPAQIKIGTPEHAALKAEYDALKAGKPEPVLPPMQPQQDVNLQNRDRGRAASVVQMSEIARNPDYMRLGPSRTPDSGAPMVFAVDDRLDAIAPQNFGRQDVAVMSDGQRVPFRYAVVDATKVNPSNFADGRQNPGFNSATPGTLKALNNGRSAGVRAAHEMGTAGEYVSGLQADEGMHGIPADVITRTPNPMLVRIYSDGQNTAGMAAKSQGQGLGMSPAELARQDAPLMDSSVLSVYETGEVTSAGNRDFVRAFMGKLQVAGQDVAGMMTGDGQLSQDGRKRIQAALMQAAYGDSDIVEEMFDSTDTDIKAIGEALKTVAGQWANMRDSAKLGAINPQVDVTQNLIQAIGLIRKARRDNTMVFDLVNQPDLMTGEAPDPTTVGLLRMFYSGQYMTRAVGKDRLTKSLGDYLAGAMATSADAGMFGDVVTAGDILATIIPIAEGQGNAETQPQESGGKPVGSGTTWRSTGEERGRRQGTGEGGVGSDQDSRGQSGPDAEAEAGQQTGQGDQGTEESDVASAWRANAGQQEDADQPTAATGRREGEAEDQGVDAGKFPNIETVAGLSAGPGGMMTPRPIAPGRTLHRETNLSGLDDLLRLDGRADLAGFFVADNPDLALGQGDNKGVQIVFRADSLSGREHQKPMTGDMAGREYKTDMVAPRAVQTITMKALDVVRLRGLTRRALADFEKEVLGEGLMRYHRKGLPRYEPLTAAKTEGVAKPKRLTDEKADLPILTAPTVEDVEARQDAAEAAKRALEADKRRADEEERARRERADIEQASVAAADTFELGEDAMANLTGQQDIFGISQEGIAPVQRSVAAEPEKGAGDGTTMNTADVASRDDTTRPNASADESLLPTAEKAQPANLTPQAARNEDVGQQLYANRRNFTGRGLSWDDVSSLNDTLKVKEVTKAKVWPRPNYEQLVADGTPPVLARMVKQVYDSISAGPTIRSGTPPTDAELKLYIDTLGKVREGLFGFVSDRQQVAEFARGVLTQVRGEPTALAPVSVLDMSKTAMGAEQVASVLLRRIWPEELTKPTMGRFSRGSQAHKEIAIVGGNKALGGMQFTRSDISKWVADLGKGWPGKREAWEVQGYRILAPGEYTGAGQEMPDGTIRMSIRQKEGRGSWRANLTDQQMTNSFLLVQDGGFNAEPFPTRDAATEAARAKVKRNPGAGQDIRGTNIEKAERTGPARRQEGEEVTSQRLMDTFGFRGVNFGREGWINQAERQAYLNQAYDGLLDLADVLGMPPKAISLDGALGIAFGAQGKGKNAAHFIAGVNEINLTKTKGAGTLAHEWGHAMDHHFATLAALEKDKEPFLSEHASQPETRERMVIEDGKYVRKTIKTFGDDIRPEIVQAFRAIHQAMEKRNESIGEAKMRRDVALERAQKQLAGWIKAARRAIEGSNAENKADLLAEFDQHAEKFRQGDTGDGYEKAGKQVFSARVAAVRNLIKDATGRVWSKDETDGLESNARYVKSLVGKQEADSEHLPQQVSTQYRRDSLAMDKEKGGKAYWGTSTEMFARAFELYVHDKLSQKGAMNTFLTDAERRASTPVTVADTSSAMARGAGSTRDLYLYPVGQERETLREAFDNLVGQIKTKETDKGVTLFSRSRKGTMPEDMVRLMADTITSRWESSPPVVVVPNMQDMRVPQDAREEDARQRAAGATGVPRGFYHRGTVYLVADGLSSARDTAETLFHEALGHYGLRAVFGVDLLPILDQIAMARPDLMRPKAIEYGKDLKDVKQRRQVAEEVLAEMAQTKPDLGYVRRAIAVVRSWLRKHVPGFEKMVLTDSEIINNFILPARGWVERGEAVMQPGSRVAFSRSAMKSVTANIDRGLSALAKAVTDKTTVHRAMFRNGLGWVDFVWGDEGVVKPNGRTKGGRGLSHIVEARMRKDGLTEGEAINMLGEMVRAIAAGTETKRQEEAGTVAVKVQHDGYMVALVKNPGANAWVITAFEIGPDARPAGYATAAPTQTTASLARDGLGAGPVAPGDTSPSLSRATRGDSTERGGTAGAGSTSIMSLPDVAGNSMFSRSTLGSGQLPPPQTRLQKLKAKALQLTSPEAIDNLIYELQDKNIDLKRLRDHIKELGGTITDLNDAYLGEELYHKRVAKRTEDFLSEELKPLLADLRARGLDLPTFEAFLHARHAPEANRVLAERNPNAQMIDVGKTKAAADVKALQIQLQRAQVQGSATKAIEQALDMAREELSNWTGVQAFKGTEDERLSLSGMSDAGAEAFMSGLKPGQRVHLKALAARVDAMNAKTLDTLEKYGLMEKSTLDAWRNTYQHYVPLHRDEAHPDSVGHPIGQGFSTKGDAGKRRAGSNEKVTNILAHIAMQREAALTRGEKNRVAKKLYLMAAQNPDPEVWSVDKPPMTRTVDRETGFVRTGVDPTYRNKPNVVMVRIGGKDHAIVFNERNPTAVRMAHSIKSADLGDLNAFDSIMGKATRWLASVNTQYNPIFGIINFARDVQAAVLQLSTTPLAGQERAVAAHVPAALKGIYAEVRSRRKGQGRGTGQWAKLWEDMQDEGGTTGYRELFITPDERVKALEKELGALERGKASEAAHAIVDWLSDYNETMENAVRLSAYKVALERGMSKERAASLAKNLTVNFNRRGRQTAKLGAYYAFLNAAIQGSTRMVETLRGPMGKKIMLGGVMFGAVNSLIAMTMMGAGDDEDDNWEKIPEFVKERSVIIPLGKEDYLAIPMPLGYHVLPNMGRKAVEMMMHNDPTLGAGTHIAEMARLVLDAFNPLGGSQNLAQMAMPTPFDPALALVQNRDWTGKPIYREDSSNLDPTPGHTRTKDSASTFSKGVSEALVKISGGSDYQPGAINWTPDQIDYIIGQLTGGLGREIMKVEQTITAPFTGEDLPPNKIPLAGRLYGNTRGPASESEKFYENVTKLNGVEREIKGRARDGEDYETYMDQEPLADLVGLGDSAQNHISKLRQLRREAIRQAQPGYQDEVKEINAQIGEVMKTVNQEVKRAKMEAVQ